MNRNDKRQHLVDFYITFDKFRFFFCIIDILYFDHFMHTDIFLFLIFHNLIIYCMPICTSGSMSQMILII